MAGGVTELTVIDGNGASRTVNVYSSTGGAGGNLSPMQTLVGADLATPASTSNPVPVESAPYVSTPVASFQQITPTVATALTVPGNATFAMISCENGDVRWRDDGTNPTGSVGMRMSAGQAPQMFTALSAVKFIDVTGNAATVSIAYYK